MWLCCMTIWTVVVGALLLCLVHADAASVTVGAAFQDQLSSSTVLSYYNLGMKSPASEGSSNVLSFEVSWTSTAISYGYLIYSIFSQKQTAFALFGPSSTFMMFDMYKYQGATGLVSFGPLAQTLDISAHYSTFNGYFAPVYWTVPLDGAQTIGLMYFLAQQPNFPVKQAIFATGDWGIGNTGVLLLKLQLPLFGSTVVTSSSSSTYSSTVSQNPGVLYMLGEWENADNSANSDTTTWCKNMVSDPTLRTANTTIVFPFMLINLVLTDYVAATSTRLPPGNFIGASPVPGVDDNTYTATQSFVAQETSSYPSGHTNSLLLYLYAGWASGWALIYALAMYTSANIGNAYAANFYANLLNAQASFLVVDLFIGSYGPSSSCANVAVSQGAVCNCHSGGNNVFFVTFTQATGSSFDVATVPNALFQYALGKCANIIPPGDVVSVTTPYTELVSLYVPQRLVGLSTTDNTMIEDMCTVLNDVVSLLSNRALYAHLASNLYFSTCVSTTTTSATTALSTLMSTWVTTALMGVIPDTVVASSTMSSTFVLDFIPQTTQPRRAQANLVYLFPTLDQELYVLASYLRGIVTAASVVCGVVTKSTSSSAIEDLLTKTLTTFTLPYEAANIVTVTGTGALLGTSIPDGCTHTFAVGLGSTDAAGLVTYLQGHASATVFVSFDDVTKYYGSVQTAFGGLPSSVTDRLVFATNLPSWTATPSNPTAVAAEAPLTTVEQFLQSVPTSLHTPAALRSYFAAKVEDRVCATGCTLPLLQEMSTGRPITVGDVVFGPFSTSANLFSITGEASVGNYGAVDISVWSYTRVVSPTTALLQPPSTPLLGYESAPLTPHTYGVVKAAAAPVLLSRVNEEEQCIEYSHDSSVEKQSSSHHSSASHSNAVMSSIHSRIRSTHHSSSITSHASSNKAINALLIVFGVLLVIATVLLLLAMLWYYGCCTCLRRCNRASPNYTKCGESVMKRHAQGVPGVQELQHKAEDVSRSMAAATDGTTTAVFVDVSHARPLWVRAPEVMSRVSEHYQRCVREAVLRHGCVEVRAVGGVFVVWCPSASAGLHFCQDVRRGVESLREADVTALAAVLVAPVGTVHNATGVVGLHLGMHTASNTRGGDSQQRLGNGVCPDKVVDVAMSASFCGRPGDIVLTGGTHTLLPEEDATVCELLATQPTGTTDVLQLHQLFIHPAASMTLPPRYDAAKCSNARQMLEYGSETNGSAASSLCMAKLDLLLSTMGDTSVTELLAMCQYLCVDAPVRAESADDAAYVDVLKRAVADRLGSLMECRHGIPRFGQVHDSITRPVCAMRCVDGSPLKENGWFCERGGGDIGGISQSYRRDHSSTRRGVPASFGLRHFAYDSTSDGVPSVLTEKRNLV